MVKYKLLSIIFFISIIIACQRKEFESVDPNIKYNLTLPAGFPPIQYPADNEPTVERIALGKMLFEDKILSLDTSVSCQSCHQQQMAFSDGRKFSEGFNKTLTERNAPGLFNLGYHSSFFWDGGVPTMELQVLAPIQNPKEMNLPIDEAINRLKNHPTYPALFRKAYNRNPDGFSLIRAIAAFERTLISGNSKFDRYQFQGKPTVMNSSELRGMKLFFDDSTHCSTCHDGFNFTNNLFANNGLYTVYADEGRKKVTGSNADLAKFKTPSLRNIALTAPYMHDGSMATLEDVIEHYNKGGVYHKNVDTHIHKMFLSSQQKTDLINFLKTLTDDDFVIKK